MQRARKVATAKLASARLLRCTKGQAAGRAACQPRSFSYAALAPASKTPRLVWAKRLALGSTAASAAGLAVASGGDPEHARALLAAVPRTGNAMLWCGRSLYEYSRLHAAHPERSGDAYEAASAATHQKCAQKLLVICQANGSLYIKAAQALTTVPSVPEPYRKTLEVLQDRVTPQPFAEIDQVLKRELGAGATELFAEFETEATAAASLAQVHRARLPSGEVVAVKLQYSGLESAVAADLATFSALAACAGLIFPDFKLGWIVKDLERQLSHELDFEKEAANSRALAAAVSDNPAIIVPHIHDSLSNARVIVMSWASGIKVTDKEALQTAGLQPREVGTLLLHTFAEMAFCRGVVHGDPHPGNILVRPSPHPQGRIARWLRRGRSVPPQLVLLDHGSYIHLGEKLRQQYCQLWCSFILNDTATARQVSHEIGGRKVASLLPLLLKPGALGKMPKKQKERIREETGLTSFGDVGRLIELMPRQLALYLKVSAVVRATAASLGCGVHDRLRINAAAALKGLSIREAEESRCQRKFIGGLGSRRKRVELSCRIYLLCWIAWMSHLWQLATEKQPEFAAQ